MFNTRNVGKTLVTRTQGTKVRRVSPLVDREATAAGWLVEGPLARTLPAVFLCHAQVCAITRTPCHRLPPMA